MFSSMRARFRGKVSEKTGRTIREHRELPFNLEEFRTHVLRFFKFGTNGTARCHYCLVHLDAGNFCNDHEVPVSRGGELGLENLVIACDDCNRAKGSLNGSEFERLLCFLQTFDEAASRDVLTRLKMGSGYRRLMIRAQKIEKDKTSGVMPRLIAPAEPF